MRATLVLLVVGIAVAASEAGVVGESPAFGKVRNPRLRKDFSYQHRENEAIARLYENVLDVLQCRIPYEQVQSNRENLRRPVQDQEWKSPTGLGQVAGVAIDPQGRPVIFHRGNHVWEYDSFDANYQYTKLSEGAIGVPTVLTLDPETGEIKGGWGEDVFYLPHGIFIDSSGNFWLTDIALHQVFKFQKQPFSEPGASLVMGERFVPGGDVDHFCQPTAVAVLPSGEIVVADGYCNDRIILFDANGNFISQLPPRGNEDFLRLRVPHSLTLLKRGDLCVADREHQRIICFNLTTNLQDLRDRGTSLKELSWLPLVVHRPGVCRIFGIASHDDVLYAVNGPTTPNNPVMGFTLNPDNGSVLSTWSPTFDSFSNPHDIAVDQNGTALYVTEIGPNKVWKFRLILTNLTM